MKGYSGGAVAGVLVGAAALVGLSLVEARDPGPERIGVVEEVDDGQSRPLGEAPADEAMNVGGTPEAAAPADAGAEAGAVPMSGNPSSPEPALASEVPSSDPLAAGAETTSPEAVATVPEAPPRALEADPPPARLETEVAQAEPEAAAGQVAGAAPGMEIAATPGPETAPEPEAPVVMDAMMEPEEARPSPSPEDGLAEPAEEDLAAEDLPPPEAPALPDAVPLSPEEALGVVQATEAAPVGSAPEVATSPDTAPSAVPMPDEAPAPAPGEAPSVAAMPDEAEVPALPTRLQVGGNALPGRDVVRVNRPGAEAPAEEPAPAAEEAVASEEPALRRHAAAWEPPAEERPRLALVLLDDGAADPQAVAALPWPVSVALDPTAPDAAGRLEAYRAAGIEALVLARLPVSAQPVDVAGVLGDSLAQLPETVAVLDLGEGGLAGRDATAQMAMAIVAREGRGLVLGNDRLGAGLALAGREGIPAAELLRDLDGEGQDAAAIRRGLDDAARRVGQEGQGIVLARARAETLEALAAWAGEGRAQDVTVAPVSEVLGQ